MQPKARFALAAAVALGLCAPSAALADDTIKHPGDHPKYAVEIEPHLIVGWDSVFASNGVGVGSRFNFPIVQNGFVPSINNSVAIGFGVDLMHYERRCAWRGVDCTANYLWLPVVMQWNFYVGQRWSVFGEPGLVVFKGFFEDGCAPGLPCGDTPSSTGLRPALWAGGRYHFSESVSLTMRIGWPSVTVGASFFL